MPISSLAAAAAIALSAGAAHQHPHRHERPEQSGFDLDATHCRIRAARVVVL